MQPAHGTSTTSAADAGQAPAPPLAHDAALDDVLREFRDRWDIAKITGGYRAILRDPGGRAPVVLYGRTPGELAESIRMAEGLPVTGHAASAWDVFTGSPAMHARWAGEGTS